ncbi:acyl-CoA--6-aminopenicillanic acid acyl-transferase [Parapedobacter pyrenivorans]|uniref:Acyl-CoA--6-aminopenicillanic acid acyl-transferase n=1 Tax=Parapedobacter pyrenivorans TaxID=1305674 RepID=A0A917HLX4_9SPHI|nr:C45 family peptidase [Parapedobacter pyrenivorans]GGG82999.1 acyl-CoA--6-aminopenicillanic acid acyl-transferase [Parapedobacter pyrenivorans]
MNIQLFYRVLGFLSGSYLMLSGSSCGGIKQVPQINQYQNETGKRTEIAPDSYVMPNGTLRKNDQGIWELYVAGDPLQRGLANGVLTKELLYRQETAFVAQVKELVPSRFRQWLLRRFLRFFNRRLIDHVPAEYQVEIYGLSRSASDTFSFLAPPYQRLMYFHGAHDIGHALRDLALVGCTSFAAWGEHTADGKLLIGRNFDFYAGDEFAEEKIMAFINPQQGYKHAMVTWAGMVGAVSGMNEMGLTVTINAGKSDIPHKAKTPIGLLTREILQYAANIDDAVRIAKRRAVFVSEAIMVGSAADGKAVLIEVSPKKFGVYEVTSSQNLLICTNHFQSQVYQSDKNNMRQLAESHSQYRFDRMNELIASAPPLTPTAAATLLRDKDGISGAKLGYGNEKAINQLLAHHAVVFQPEDRLMWVSSTPYQLGEFVAYDLDAVFRQLGSREKDITLAVDTLNIASDAFVESTDFENYEEFRVQMRNLETAIEKGLAVPDEALNDFMQLNPAFWKTSFLIGEYLYEQRKYDRALHYFQVSASKEVATLRDKDLIRKRIRKCERKR